MKRITLILLAVSLVLAISSKAACQSEPIELQSSFLDPANEYFTVPVGANMEITNGTIQY